MRPSLRFLAIAVIGWAGVRAATLGTLPGAEIFKIERGEAKPPPPIVATQFPPIDPIAPSPTYPSQVPYFVGPQGIPIQFQPVPVPVYYSPAPASQPAQLTPILPTPAPHFYAPVPALDEWPLSRIAAASTAARQSTVIVPAQSTPAAFRTSAIDRVQLSAWALLRGRQGQILGTPSLAPGGTLGGSQAGARLFYNFDRRIAATLRSSSDVGRRGGEVAAGIRVHPAPSIPIWLTAERRQRLGSGGSGRNAFAVFAEGGVYQKSMPWRFELDAYLQAGIVGLHRRDGFVDGGLTFSRPVYRQFSGGFGVWGAAQPGVYRIDAGPRVTMKVRNNMKVHVDWRQRVAGNAEPGSGPAVTLAGDF
jgi:hypothetical protein